MEKLLLKNNHGIFFLSQKQMLYKHSLLIFDLCFSLLCTCRCNVVGIQGCMYTTYYFRGVLIHSIHTCRSFVFFFNCYSFATVLILHFLIFPKTQYISEFSIIFLIINQSDFLLTYIYMIYNLLPISKFTFWHFLKLLVLHPYNLYVRKICTSIYLYNHLHVYIPTDSCSVHGNCRSFQVI